MFFESAYIIASEAAWIDIANANVHKGTTVEQLQRILNVTPEETMVFGDGYNDMELLVCGTYSFAVRNAVQEIKDAANFITRSNEEDAVIKQSFKCYPYRKITIKRLIGEEGYEYSLLFPPKIPISTKK